MGAKETFYIKKGIKEELHFNLKKKVINFTAKINFPFLKSWDMRTKLKHIIRGWPFYFKLDNSSRYRTGINRVIYLKKRLNKTPSWLIYP